MCAVFGDQKAAVWAHQEARESFLPPSEPWPLEPHHAAGLSLLPAVTDARCISCTEGDVGADAASTLVSSKWEEGSGGGEEGSSFCLLPLPRGVTCCGRG